jgi:dipeptide/tripeptide permease
MRILAFAIIGVGVATAVLIWLSLHLVHDAEKMERNPRLLRRRLLIWGTLYVVSSVWGIIQVVRGNEPPAAFVGIVVAAGFAWLLIRGASRVNTGQ